jgi:hypothetical protein
MRFLRTMRKTIDPSLYLHAAADHGFWIELESSAEIAITSEDPAHPIEAALLPGTGQGWKASQPGVQSMRIIFDYPQSLKRIYLVFREEGTSRTQEFVLRWSAGEDWPLQEIVRQQYNFSPLSTEIEDYAVDLHGVTILELEITPSISGGDIRASLAEMRVR